MEDLIELVAASFARHGIVCPADDREVVEKRASAPVEADPAALPEHNFRKTCRAIQLHNEPVLILGGAALQRCDDSFAMTRL